MAVSMHCRISNMAVYIWRHQPGGECGWGLGRQLVLRSQKLHSLLSSRCMEISKNTVVGAGDRRVPNENMSASIPEVSLGIPKDGTVVSYQNGSTVASFL